MSLQRLDNIEAVLSQLKSMESEENRSGMGRFGINVENALGIKVTDLRKLARRVEKNHELALQLWDSGVHEARILATVIDRPAEVTEEQMEQWAAGFDSWDIVDQACNNLFRKTPFAHDKAVEWADRKEEFVKRAGFALMAVLAVHDKVADNAVFERYLELVEREAKDDRNFVKKAVNWALRGIGKRNTVLRGKAIETAGRVREQGTKSARWIANDALRELEKDQATS
jgi:3-methyladenine DNA glycosylase AlkD